MKTAILSLLLLLFPMASFSIPLVGEPEGVSDWGDQCNGTYKNPVLNADFSDPDVIRVGNEYFMICSDFHFMGMQIWKSYDMVNWQFVTQIYDSLPFKEYDTMDRYAGGSWAPALRYHDGEFYVYFCTRHEGLFMTHAKSAEGPWAPLHCVKKIADWEDPCPFWDEDGQAYLGHSVYGAGPIIMHRMSADGKTLLDDGVEVYRGPVAEGTKIHKWNGLYYMSIPEGGVKSGWQTILRSKNIYGPYESKRVLEQGSTNINGPHQGAIVDTPNGEWWFYHFQETDALGRVLHLQPMTWRDGWPSIGVDYDGNGIGEPVSLWTTPSVSPTGGGTIPQIYHLSDARLPSSGGDGGGLCGGVGGGPWQWNHNPVPSAFSFSEHPGWLTLHALPAPSFKKARNTYTLRAVGYQPEYTISMSLEEMADGQRCGMACMGKYNTMLGALMQNGKRYLYLATDTTETILSELPIEMQHRSLMSSKAEKNHEGIEIAPQNGGPIHPLYIRLRLNFPEKRFEFFYSLDGLHFTKAGNDFYTRWGNWKGVRPAVFCYQPPLTPPNGGGKARRKAVSEQKGSVQVKIATVPNASPLGSPAPVPEASASGLATEVSIVSNIARTSFPSFTITVTPPVEGTGEVSGEVRRDFQHAIDSCSLAGGGTVIVKPGEYHLNGSLFLKSDVNLHLEKGAILKFSGNADDFLPTVFTRWEGTELYGHSAMIYANHATNIAITGEGVIDANAGVEMSSWGPNEATDRDRLRDQGERLVPVSERQYGKGTILRPSAVEFVGCSRILLENVTIKNSPFWTIHPIYCDNVIVRGVTIDTHFANNDGCDPDATSNVLIENCVFNVGDDAIAIKSGRDADGRRVGRPSKNIVIRNCLFNSECNGLCIGSEMSGGVENVFMHDIQIGTVKNAIYFKSNRDRGGYIRNVFVDNITVQHALGAVLRFETNYFGFRGGKHASQYENFHINNIDVKKSDHYAFFISGYPEKPVRNVVVNNMTVAEAPQPYYMHCTESVTLDNCRVNGNLVPQHPENEPDERTLDVW